MNGSLNMAEQAAEDTANVAPPSLYTEPARTPIPDIVLATPTLRAYFGGMSTAPDDFRLAPERATELVRVAAALGISPAELLDRAVRRELARALLEEVYSATEGLDEDAALALAYSERDAARAGA